MSTPLRKTFTLDNINLEKGQKIKRSIFDKDGDLQEHIYTITDYKFSGMYEDENTPLYYAVYALSDENGRIELTQEDLNNPESEWKVLS